MAIFLLILSSIPILHGYATSTAVVSVDPDTITVGDPLPTDSFTVNINVTNVEGMYGWQVKIYFNDTILNCTSAVYPTDHVFDGKQYIPVSPVIGEDYMMFGATLYYEEDVFSGNGTLCQITFVGEAVGTSALEFDSSDTYLLDFDLNMIEMTSEEGSVTVIPEFVQWLIIPVIIITTLAAAFLSKIALSKNRPNVNTVKR